MTDSKLAFVFPGQGSQAVGMLDDLAAAFPLVRDTFAEASEVLGYDLWTLTSNGPKESLDQTERTQPAMLTAAVAVWRCWQARGGAEPSVMAGHSLGEYSALVCGGVLKFADAVALVAEEGYTVAKAARAVDVNENNLRRWKKELEQEATGERLNADERAELSRLRRRENTELRMEKEILKKASAFFAKEMK